jgi:hypothetical protein
MYAVVCMHVPYAINHSKESPDKPVQTTVPTSKQIY